MKEFTKLFTQMKCNKGEEGNMEGEGENMEKLREDELTDKIITKFGF
ncbi:MAG: hypothetical protein AB1297_08595 [bacterium]